MKNDYAKGYLVQLLLQILISSAFSCTLVLFLMLNVTQVSSYLYAAGNDSTAVRYFSGSSILTVVLYVLLGIVFFSVSFLWMQRRTIHTLSQLSQAVERIAEGDLEHELEPLGEDELGRVAESINRMQREIKQLMEAERASEKSKNELITNVAHDLRTPLTSIRGYLDILNKSSGQLSAEQRQKYLAIVDKKTRRLQELLESLFDFTKLSYGHLSMKLGELDIVRLLGQLLEENYPNFAKQGLSYEFTTTADQLVLRADGNLLARLFENLLSNAIKYGAEGKKVIVRLRTQSRQDCVEVDVINYGHVIPEQELPLIFEKFYRLERSRSLQTGGTGLGLAIVKDIAEMHGGSVQVRSDYNGTVFTVTLPLHFEIKEAEQHEEQ